MNNNRINRDIINERTSINNDDIINNNIIIKNNISKIHKNVDFIYKKTIELENNKNENEYCKICQVM